jgi:hypothetical protein
MSRENVFGASYIKENEELFKNMDDLVFGRVINLKFIRKNLDVFTIRSDYEPVYRDDNTVEFVVCSQKPSIKVSYNQVANDTAIEVRIQIDGFYIDREASGNEIDSNEGNPIEWAVVQLGYLHQFPDWRKMTATADLEKFYSLDNNSVTSDAGVQSGREMVVQVLYTTPLNNPPDRSWLCYGVLGTLDQGLRWSHTVDDLTANYGDDNFPNAYSEIEALFYQWITRRFIRPSVLHRSVTSTKKVGTTIEYTQSIKVYQYKKYFDETVTDNSWTALTLMDNGLMTFEDANMFGCVCACSKVLRSMPIHSLYKYGSFGAKVTVTEINETVFDEPMDALGAQLRAIQAHYPFIRWYILKDGSFYIYHASETVDDVFQDPVVKKKQLKNPVILPAVYDITMSGTRIIRCPFINRIDPMTTVLFQSRYRTVDMTGYYYQPKKGMDAFLVLLSSIEFSTTGDENEMVLTCDDIPEDQMPEYDGETGVVTVVAAEDVTSDYTDNVTNKQEERNKKWAEVNLAVGKYPLDDKKARWTDIAKTYLLSAVDPAMWGGVLPTIERALTDLKEWNKNGVWTDARLKNSEGASPENKLYKDLSVKIPWLYKDDPVIVRTPYLPSYDDTYKEKEVTYNG